MERRQDLRRALHAASASSRSSPATCRCRSRSSRSRARSRAEVADGAALWTKPRSEIKPEEYTDFYRSVAGQFDEPALTIHYRAEGRHEYSVLAFVPGSQPFDLFDPDRKGRMKLYVKRVFITDDADLLPRYLRFVRGIVDFVRPAAQRLARDDPGEPDPRRDQEGRHQPRPRRPREARRRRSRSLTPRSGTTSAAC